MEEKTGIGKMTLMNTNAVKTLSFGQFLKNVLLGGYMVVKHSGQIIHNLQYVCYTLLNQCHAAINISMYGLLTPELVRPS